jgi:hypothetical protein
LPAIGGLLRARRRAPARGSDRISSGATPPPLAGSAWQKLRAGAVIPARCRLCGGAASTRGVVLIGIGCPEQLVLWTGVISARDVPRAW